MTYGQLKKMSMQLIFSESLAGEPIGSSYNNQADYLRMIPGLANDGMIYLATTVKKIPEIVPLSSLSSQDFGDYTMYTLPENFWRLMNGGLIWRRPDEPFDDNYSYQRFKGYKLYANNRLMIPKRVPNLDTMMVEYYRFPQTLPDNPADSAELDNTPETHAALPFYIAANLVLYDDPYRYASLWNAFETRIERISEQAFVEYAPVDDAYGAFGAGGVF